MRTPPLVSKNRFEGLSVDTVSDCDTSSSIVDSDSCKVTNSRGSQETELGAPEACLIPIPNTESKSDNNDSQKPKEGVKDKKFFIHSARIEREILFSVSITTMDTHDTVPVKALLDSGATGLFIDRQFVHKNGLKTRILPIPIKVYNVDGSLNQGGSITEEVTLMMSHRGHKEKAVFEVCDLGKAVLIIGHPWLRKHNPEINWKTGEVKLTHCPLECNVFICAA